MHYFDMLSNLLNGVLRGLLFEMENINKR